MEQHSFKSASSSRHLQVLLLTILLGILLCAGTWWSWQRYQNQPTIVNPQDLLAPDFDPDWVDKATEKRYKLAWSRAIALSDLAEEYANDHGGRFPPASRWEEALRPYHSKKKWPFEDFSKLVISPLHPGQRRFAMNRAFSNFRLVMPGALTGQEFDDAILFFESFKAGPNATEDTDSYATLLPRLMARGQVVVSNLGSGQPELYLDFRTGSYYPAQPIQALKERIRRNRNIGRAIAARQQRR